MAVVGFEKSGEQGAYVSHSQDSLEEEFYGTALFSMSSRKHFESTTISDRLYT